MELVRYVKDLNEFYEDLNPDDEFIVGKEMFLIENDGKHVTKLFLEKYTLEDPKFMDLFALTEIPVKSILVPKQIILYNDVFLGYKAKAATGEPLYSENNLVEDRNFNIGDLVSSFDDFTDDLKLLAKEHIRTVDSKIVNFHWDQKNQVQNVDPNDFIMTANTSYEENLIPYLKSVNEFLLGLHYCPVCKAYHDASAKINSNFYDNGVCNRPIITKVERQLLYDINIRLIYCYFKKYPFRELLTLLNSALGEYLERSITTLSDVKEARLNLVKRN